MRKLHLTPDVHIGVRTGFSFDKAVSDIRSYLDRFPYEINDYQIIVAMRSDYKKATTVWRETFLSRLLDIDFNLRKSNILIKSGLSKQIAVNLIMLYETDVVTDIHSVDKSYVSSRLLEDSQLLLKEIGVSKDDENNLDAIKEAWKQYIKTNSSLFENCPKMDDGTPANALYIFLIV
ncbi:hypothetical protein P261_00119 [Lachnospiraceae bacterium TWA4]|nr:hypothetical protein P261_00119 [Lachnospiraceae bacterium TWA4]